MNGITAVLTFEIALYGIIYFTRGFLLQKQVLEEVNSDQIHSSGSWDHVIILVIDALKYDFVIGGRSQGLTEVQRLVQKQSNHSAVFKFVADPPTTTLQRLKGLTTGSLPTFIEASSNFGGSAILEDNLIDQLKIRNRSIVFMGDDTWESLFPGKFLRSHPFPSFDVWDLDTVDRGVEKYIQHELNNTDWNLLIAHCLGVDHAGHRYGPDHPEMTRKFLEMDSLIKLIVKDLPDNSLFLVLGDHGMTSTGDHGGDTDDEVNAALFAYSNSHPFAADIRNDVPQVDLVPTLAVALGIPIPFSNIGRIIKGLTPTSSKTDDEYESVILENAKQVWKYVNSYVSHCASTLPPSELTKLTKSYEVINFSCSEPDCKHKSVIHAEEFLIEVQKYLRSSWSEFSLSYMLIGTAFVFASFLFGCFTLVPSGSEYNNLATGVAILNLLIVMATYSVKFGLVFEPIFVILGTSSVLYILVRRSNFRVPFGLTSMPAVCTVFFTNLVFFSNSLTVEEPAVLRFCLCSFILYTKFTIQNSRLINRTTAIFAAILVQVNRYFDQCREENGPSCENYQIFKPLSSLIASDATATLRIVLALSSVIVLCYIARPKIPEVRKLLYFTAVSLSFYWTCEYFGALNLVHNAVPNIVFLSWSVIVILSVSGVVNGCDVVYFTAVFLMVLVGDGVAPSIFSILLVVYLWKKGQAFSDCKESALFLTVLTWSGFFCGRNATFSSIQWNAAFVGINVFGNPADAKSVFFDFLLPMAKVGMATFGSQIICGLVAGMSTSPGHSGVFIGLSALRLLCSMQACTVLRRHLMMWKIFAPRFVFEGVGFIVYSCAFIIAQILFRRKIITK